MAIRARRDERVTLRSSDLNDEGSFSLGGLGDPSREWIDYVRGVAWALRETGKSLVGFEGVVSGSVPVGAGLSSSAAIELAAARAFASVSGFFWDPVEIA